LASFPDFTPSSGNKATFYANITHMSSVYYANYAAQHTMLTSGISCLYLDTT